MYRIGLFSKYGKTTIKTLRYYDEIGLLKPAYIDDETGYRYYATSQLFKLHDIVSLRQMGFAIADIIAIMDGRHVDEIISKRKVEVENQLSHASEQLSRINNYINNRKEDNIMDYKAVVKDIPECIVFSKRQVMKDYNDLFTIIPAIGEAIGKANPSMKCSEPEYSFNIYHDGEHKTQDIDFEYCEAVEAKGVETDGIVFKTMPAIAVASTMHKGSYSELGAAYAFIFKWIEENDYTIAGNPRESYIDGIWNKNDEAEWLTEVQVPIAKLD